MFTDSLGSSSNVATWSWNTFNWSANGPAVPLNVNEALRVKRILSFNLVVVSYEKRQKPFKHQELELVFEKFFKKVKSFKW